MAQRTDREISADLHRQLTAQSTAVRRLAVHAPQRYIQALLEQASALLDSANTCWHEEEQQAGTPLWR